MLPGRYFMYINSINNPVTGLRGLACLVFETESHVRPRLNTNDDPKFLIFLPPSCLDHLDDRGLELRILRMLGRHFSK